MGIEGPDDASLMIRVKNGDMDAFEILVDRHKQAVANLLYRTLPDATEIEDLAQVVFVQVFKSAHRYEPSAKFTTWLFTIARNLCLNEIRRRSRHPADSLDELTEDRGLETPKQFRDTTERGPEELVLRSELEEKVNQAIQALPESQRTALMLCCDKDLSYQDISSVIGCSLSATKSLIHRARETLKEKLKPYLKTGVWVEK